jgi:hypothetical protein
MQTATTPSQAPQTRRKLTPNEVAEIQRPAHTPAEVAAILRMHPVFVRSLFTGRRIPGAVRIGSRWILPAPALDRILAEGLALPGKQKAAR